MWLTIFFLRPPVTNQPYPVKQSSVESVTKVLIKTAGAGFRDIVTRFQYYRPLSRTSSSTSSTSTSLSTCDAVCKVLDCLGLLWWGTERVWFCDPGHELLKL